MLLGTARRDCIYGNIMALIGNEDIYDDTKETHKKYRL